jgi:hypothetical protein
MKLNSIADFEKYVLGSTWDEAQDILHQGGVTALMEADKFFWTARVFDGSRSYEVEILLTGKRLKGFTCDCWVEHRLSMCKHVAAAAAALRQYLELKESERRALQIPKQVANSSDRLNISTILKRTPPEALADFIQEYASEDKAFATLLKSRFASWLSGDVNYYTSIILGLIPKKHTGSLTTTELRKVQRIIHDLVRQQKGAFAEGDMQKAWLISEAIVKELPRLVVKMRDLDREPYQMIFQNAYLFVLRLTKDQVSPELWERRAQFVFDLLEHKSLSDSAIRLVITAMQKESDFWVRVDEKFAEAEQPIPFGVLSGYAAHLVQRKMGAGLADVIRHFVPETDTAVRLVLQLFHLGYDKETLACGKLISAYDQLSLMHKNTLGQVMLASATKIGDQKEMMLLLSERFFQSSNMEYYDQMKALSGAKWTKQFDKIVQILTKKGDLRLLCQIYIQEKDFDAVFRLLVERNDYQLLHQIEKALINHEPKRIADTYVTLFQQYLTGHFGTPSADFVRGHMLTLLKQGGVDIAKEIAQRLSTLYHDRVALIEAFQDLFPKYRKMIKPFVSTPK